MKISITRAPGNGITRERCLRTVGVALAIASIFTTASLRAEETHRGGGGQQHSQGHAPRQQAVRHDDHGRGGRGGGGYGYGDQGYGYGYGGPPVIYAPGVVPGINLFLPL